MKKTLVGKLCIGNPFIASVLLKSCRSGIVALAIGLTVVTLPQIGFAQTSSPAAKAVTTLSQWTFDSTTNQLEVTLPEGTTPRYFLMAQPARIVLDLPNTAIGTVATQKTYTGAVRQIRVSQFQPGVTRFVLELASDTVLAPEQVLLQQVGNSSAQRWVLRPLIAKATPSSRPVVRRPLASPTASSPAAIVPPPTPVPSASVPNPIAAPPIVASPIAPQIDNIPPGQGVPINVPPPTITKVPVTKVPIALPDPASPDAFSTPPPVLPNIATPPPNVEATRDPLGLPPAEFPASQAVTVSVPTLSVPTPNVPTVSSPPSVPPIQPLPTQPLPIQSVFPAPVVQPTALPTGNSPLPALVLPDSALALPPAKFEASSAVTVKVPTLPSTPTPSVKPTSDPRGASVEFGQPLPGNQLPGSQSVPAPVVTPRSSVPPTQVPIIVRGTTPSRVAVTPTTPEAKILLPSGTLLNLRYPGSSALNLKVGTPLQEVLLLQVAVRDRTGTVIAPEGTPVLGRFESNNGGSRFIAQAITLQGRNVPLVGQSDPIDGGAQISQDSLLLGSGLGALAIGAIGGFNGLSTLGGAAVGAAVSYATAPRPATLQPGQVLQVRLTEALR